MACLVVSSMALRAQLLAGLLAQCCPVAIAGVCDSAAAAIAAIDCCQPHAVILDRDNDDNADCGRIARHLLSVSATARLILLSSDLRLESLPSELAPRIDQPQSWPALLRCVRASHWPSGDQSQLGDPLPQLSCFERLRPREHAVLELVGAGLGSREIALSLGVSRQTVETYRKSVSAKLGVSGARLVRIAVLYRCLNLDGPPHPGRDLDRDGHGPSLAGAVFQSSVLGVDGQPSMEARA